MKLRKPTKKQKKIISARGLTWENWNVLEEDNLSLTIVSKRSGQRRVILK